MRIPRNGEGARLRSAIARALDEHSQDECERDSERDQLEHEKQRAAEADAANRELLALERAAMALQQIAEAFSRISVSGIHVHGSR